VSSTSNYGLGYTITGPNISSGTVITAINGATLMISPKATGAQAGETLTISPSWSGLPMDKQWTGICSGGTCLRATAIGTAPIIGR
jgi:hypothetical protein